MIRYSKYFLHHALWLDDGFCQYYVQDDAWGQQEILDVQTVVFDWPEDAQQWLWQCAEHDYTGTLYQLRDYLAHFSLRHYMLHRMNDRQVMRAAAEEMTENISRVVIQPYVGWAVQVGGQTDTPELPLRVEAEPELSEMLAELKKELDALVATQKKKNVQIEAQLDNLTPEQKALFYSQKAGSGVYDSVVEDTWNIIKTAPCALWAAAKAFPGFYAGYLKTMWKIAQTPSKMASLTAHGIVTGNYNPLKQEIDKIVVPVTSTYEQAAKYKSMLTVLFNDEQTYALLYDFATRYYEATHLAELTQMAASAVADIVVTVILAIVTAGAGAAANVAAKSGRLVKVAKLLEKITATLRRIGPKAKLLDKAHDAASTAAKVEKKAAKAARKKGVPDVESPKPAIKLDKKASKGYDGSEKSSGPKKTTKTIPPRDRLAELSDAELEQVRKVSTFKTKGVSEERAIDYLSNTPEGQKVLRQVSESAPAGTDPEVIFNRAMGYVQSGTDLPKTGTIDSPLVKIAPKGQGVSDYSPYFTTMDELKKAQSSNKPLSDVFGLPANSDAAKYDVFQIKPIDKANVLKSKIAPTEELGGKFVTQGVAEQIIVPNRKQFTAPERLFSINDNV